MSLGTTVKAIGHYIEQPAVIAKAEKYAGAAALGAAGLILGHDTFRAEPGEKGKTALRTGIVLASTIAGTLLAGKAVKRYMEPLVEKLLKSGEETAEEALKKAIAGFRKENKYQSLIPLMEKETRSVDEFKTLINGMREEAFSKIADKKLAEEMLDDDLQKILPVELDNFWGSVGKMANFFSVGAASVLSGLGGGLLANKLIGDRDNKVDMIKEGIFQFIANIAMCAVGASIGISAVNLKPVAEKLHKMGMAGMALRTGIIGLGLSLGIFGGGAIANKVGKKWVNPYFDKLEGKQPSGDGGDRKIEFWDAILHLDDLPTALALAGVKIMEPFIPLFFGFSGYRTGIGYRNSEAASAPANAPSRSANPFLAHTSSLAYNNNPVFQQFHQQQRGLRA